MLTVSECDVKYKLLKKWLVYINNNVRNVEM